MNYDVKKKKKQPFLSLAQQRFWNTKTDWFGCTTAQTALAFYSSNQHIKVVWLSADGRKLTTVDTWETTYFDISLSCCHSLEILHCYASSQTVLETKVVVSHDLETTLDLEIYVNISANLLAVKLNFVELTNIFFFLLCWQENWNWASPTLHSVVLC